MFVFFKGKLLESKRKKYSVEKKHITICVKAEKGAMRGVRENKQCRQVHCCFNYSFTRGLTFPNGTGSEVAWEIVCVGGG